MNIETALRVEEMNEEQVIDWLTLESITLPGKPCTPRVMELADCLLDRLLVLKPSILIETAEG